MRARLIALLATFSIGSWTMIGAQSRKDRSMTNAKAHSRALAKITVQKSDARAYDRTSGPALMEIHLSETFVGDIDGESTVRALQVLRDDRSASMVSVQRFAGRLGGRQGTFVLQGSELIETARSRRHGSSFPDPGPVIFPGCAAKADSKETSEKGLRER